MAAGKLKWLNPAVATAAVVPFAWIAWRVSEHKLGANPVTTALNQVGLLALIFLVASLSCTPLKVAFTWTWPLRIRRTLGLCAFFCALGHLSIYAILDQGSNFKLLAQDIVKRPFIAVGFGAWLLLLPLAVTSTKRWVARLGFSRWQQLHRLAYLAGGLAVVHFYLRVKADHTKPLVYGLILGLGFTLRVAQRMKKSRDGRRRAELQKARASTASV